MVMWMNLIMFILLTAAGFLVVTLVEPRVSLSGKHVKVLKFEKTALVATGIILVLLGLIPLAIALFYLLTWCNVDDDPNHFSVKELRELLRGRDDVGKPGEEQAGEVQEMTPMDEEFGSGSGGGSFGEEGSMGEMAAGAGEGEDAMAEGQDTDLGNLVVVPVPSVQAAEPWSIDEPIEIMRVSEKERIVAVVPNPLPNWDGVTVQSLVDQLSVDNFGELPFPPQSQHSNPT